MCQINFAIRFIGLSHSTLQKNSVHLSKFVYSVWLTTCRGRLSTHTLGKMLRDLVRVIFDTSFAPFLSPSACCVTECLEDFINIC